MSTLQIGLMFGVATFIALFSGMPIAFAVGGVALVFMLLYMPAPTVALIAETLYSELDNFVLLTIPLFVLMGAAIGKSRAGGDLYSSLNRWMGRIPGGLGVANVLACSVFAAMCGSSPATCSAIGSSGIPEMRKRGYSSALAAGIIAAGGTLGILIPPSLTLILYGVVTEQSIGKLFMAGVGPGLLLTALFIVWVVIQFRREQARARLLGDNTEILREEIFTWRQKLETLPRLAPFIAIIVIIMVALYGGWATPSEVAGIGAFASLLMVMVIYGCWRWTDMKAILGGTVRESTMVMMIIAMSFLYTYVMSYLHITQEVATWMVDAPVVRKDFISQDILRVVREGMRETVTGGTAQSLRDLPVEAAGKTGTAQFGTGKDTHGWFVSFAPYADPEIAMIVLVEGQDEEGYNAVPVTKEVYQWYFGGRKDEE